MNVDGTRFASVRRNEHCVHIYSINGAGKRTADTVVFGDPGTPGVAHGQLNDPFFACFVHRNGIDTLLICDFGNDRVVEVTASGVFLRAINVGSAPLGIAERDGVIAVSLPRAHAVVLLQYESGAVKPEMTIGSFEVDDGQLGKPLGVAFTADGRCILVADYDNHRVSKFEAASGAFIAHVATNAANGIIFPRDVLQLEDGRMVVAQGCFHAGLFQRMCGQSVCVGEDGLTLPNTLITRGRAHSYSASSMGVVVKTNEGRVFLKRDAWMFSRRCAWISALSCS